MAAIGSFNPPASGTAVINTILTEEANRIGSDIYAQTLHTSPWIDLIRKSEFPSDMGYQLNTIVYERSELPKEAPATDSLPVLLVRVSSARNPASRSLTSPAP
jgi:hypothetical protein